MRWGGLDLGPKLEMQGPNLGPLGRNAFANPMLKTLPHQVPLPFLFLTSVLRLVVVKRSFTYYIEFVKNFRTSIRDMGV